MAPLQQGAFLSTSEAGRLSSYSNRASFFSFCACVWGAVHSMTDDDTRMGLGVVGWRGAGNSGFDRGNGTADRGDQDQSTTALMSACSMGNRQRDGTDCLLFVVALECGVPGFGAL